MPQESPDNRLAPDSRSSHSTPLPSLARRAETDDDAVSPGTMNWPGPNLLENRHVATPCNAIVALPDNRAPAAGHRRRAGLRIERDWILCPGPQLCGVRRGVQRRLA